MIKLYRQLNEQLSLYELLLARLPVGQMEYEALLTTYRQIKKGHAGELRADREWHDLQLEYAHVLLHDFQALNKAGFTHQIDTVFICERFVLVVELKDLAGTIELQDATGSMQQIWTDGSSKYYDHPMFQVLRHQAFLEQQLRTINCTLPVIPLVILTDLSARISITSKKIPIIKLTQLRIFMQELQKKFPTKIENIEAVSEYLLTKFHPIKRKIRHRHLPLLKGVVCEQCRVRMQHSHKSFYCSSCGQKKVHGIYEAMYAYRLLVNEWITNSEFREYVGVSSIQTANKMLKRMCPEFIGANKNRKYLIPPDILDKINKTGD